MVKHLLDITSELKVYQGIRVLVVGSHQSGKSSLVQSLVDQQPRLVDSDHSTEGVEFDSTTLGQEGCPQGKTLPLSVFDFTCSDRHLYPNGIFQQVRKSNFA